MGTEPAIPFESRVFVIPRVSWPESTEICGYCTAAQMTPQVVEDILLETEKAIGEPITHTCRKTFPQPLGASVQEEVIHAWKSRKRALQLSTKLSRPNLVTISAGRHPRPEGAAYPADWGEFRILIRRAAPDALKVITRLQEYSRISGAFFARADSPDWWESYRRSEASGTETAMPCLRIASEPGWALGSSLGWINYFGPRAAMELGIDAAARIGGAHKVEVTTDGGRLLWITAEPLNFCDEAHRQRYSGLLRELSSHVITP
jgi:hypothetical protein